MEIITKSWSIERMTCVPIDNSSDYVVNDIAWKLVGIDTLNHSIVGGYGIINAPFIPSAPFTPYTQLTQDQVINWVKDRLGEEHVQFMEDNVDKQFVATRPDTLTLTLPWATT